MSNQDSNQDSIKGDEIIANLLKTNDSLQQAIPELKRSIELLDKISLNIKDRKRSSLNELI